MLLTTLTAGTSGATSATADVSGLTGNWVLRLRVESLTSGAKVLLIIQDSTDNFVSDIQTIGIVNLTGAVSNVGAEIEKTFPWYTLPSSYLGSAGAKLRIFISSISGGSVSASLWV